MKLHATKQNQIENCEPAYTKTKLIVRTFMQQNKMNTINLHTRKQNEHYEHSCQKAKNKSNIMNLHAKKIKIHYEPSCNKQHEHYEPLHKQIK